MTKTEPTVIFEAAHEYEQRVGFGKFYPFKSAAEAAANELLGKGQYRSERQAAISHNSIRFEDEIYLVKEEIRDIPKDFAIPLGAPTDIIRVTTERRSYPQNDKYAYVKSFAEVESIFLSLKGKLTEVNLLSVIQAHDSIWLLSSKTPVTLEKFTISREIAIAHAKSKLTDEEKKLLGIT